MKTLFLVGLLGYSLPSSEETQNWSASAIKIVPMSVNNFQMLQGRNNGTRFSAMHETQ